MTAAELKASILDRAVHGLLVPQREEERFEKFEGFERFEKSTIDNPPYELPRGWVWKRLGCLVTVISGTSYKSHDVIKSGIRIFRGGNIQNGDVLYLEDDTFLPECFLDSEKTIREGDVLIVASTGSKAVIGKPGFVKKTDSKTQIGAFLRIVRPLEKKFIPYIWLIFKSEYYRQHIRGVVQGMNINNVKNEHLTEFPIPLPPLAEQKRIVAKIEELMPLVEEYGKAETELAALNDNFPTALRKSILQHAVEGRLTAAWRKANPRGETAAELLAKIAAEKKHLLAEGKIKKQPALRSLGKGGKPLPPITDDEKPFPIPDGWEWVRLGDIVNLLNGDRGANYPSKDKLLPNGDIPFISAVNMHGGTVVKDQLLYLSSTQYEKLRAGKLLRNDVVLCIRGSLGKHCIYPFEHGAIASSLVILRTGDHLDKKYLSIYIDSPLFGKEILKYDNGTAQPNLAANDAAKFLIPLPPLAEQKAIVERVEELLGLVEKIKE